MNKILLIGNPNVGKSTLFNSLTKSSEHTGNFHGVTVEAKSKIIKFEDEDYQVTDLPGIYSLNTYSPEEEISKNIILKGNSINIVLVDANCLKKNLYLCCQLDELGINYKILINNYDYFLKKNNFLNINKLKQNLKVDTEVINAKKIKINKNLTKSTKKIAKKVDYLNDLIKKIQKIKGVDAQQIIYALNGINKNLSAEDYEFITTFSTEAAQARHSYINTILAESVMVEKNFVYGLSKWDKLLLNPIILTMLFLLTFFISIYLIFFVLGSALSDLLSMLCTRFITDPLTNLIILATDNIWFIEFFSKGVFGSFFVILSFLPQVCLMFVFITVLEDSGIVSRLAYVFDDFLSCFGLNGKAIYIMLLGLGCNTMSILATRNINEKNTRAKTAVLTPYISCMARLPVFIIIASTYFSCYAYFIIAGLYILGFLIALGLGFILNRTVLKSKQSGFILEFAPIRKPDIKHIMLVAKTNAVDMLKRIAGVIIGVSIIVWILTHTNFTLKYTDNINESILFVLSGKISFLFAPIGLNNAGVVCALIVGIMAKELIVSTLSVCNNTTSTKMLIDSLTVASSAVFLTRASAISFLIFSLLYCPCVSNLAVLKQETDTFAMWFSIISQLTISYLFCFVVYQTAMHGFMFALIRLATILTITISIIYVIKKAKHGKCLACNRCKR